MKKISKGFTLVELLAVIAILAILVIIAIPNVLGMFNNARKKIYNSSTRMIISRAENYYVESSLDFSKTGIDGKTNLFNEVTKNMQGEMPESGEIYISEKGLVAVALVYNKTCYIKDFKSSDILETTDIENCKVTYTDPVLAGADPELDSAMIPVVYNSNGTISKADTKTEWYNYTNKKWANAVLVSDETRQDYKSAEAGTIIEAKDVKAYYVWIPRYKYQIFTDVNNLEKVGKISDSSAYTNKADIINITFENNAVEKSSGSAKDEWLTHPAFTFGSEELNGIWVGKFETTGTVSNPTVLAYDSRYIQTTGIKSLRSQNVSTQFATSQKINYGITSLEASMLKNMEWGAIAYLTASIYGQGKNEVMINNSSSYYTGCAATVAPTTTFGGYRRQTDHTEGYYEGCENEWHTQAGQKASTTRNMYGIYDMSGGAGEYVMGVMEDAKDSKIPASGKNNDYNSGFTGTLTYPNDGSDSSITSITGVTFPNEKYFDIYAYHTSTVFYENRGHLGDATYELDGFTNWEDSDGYTRYHSGWNKDYAGFVGRGCPWFLRGANYPRGASAGVFAFSCNHGDADGSRSFRSVLR
ncbi:MAG: prepilin-type N-terminal cleavage/methylation domain-containing protein [bacterium]|nr:prepilin-type N-terminal cleavage/methylation domain-containing protein [bacterium]